MKFNEFEKLSSQAWKQRIQFELNGEDFNSNLVWKSLEGIDVKPFYHADSSIVSNPIDHQSDAWLIGEKIFVQNVKAAQNLAKECLSKGAESICFILPKPSLNIQNLLDGIDISRIRIYLDLQFLDPSFIPQIEALKLNQNSKVFILSDCIGHLAKSGNWYSNLSTDKKKHHRLLPFDEGRKICTISRHGALPKCGSKYGTTTGLCPRPRIRVSC